MVKIPKTARFENVYLLRFSVRGKDIPVEQFEDFVTTQARTAYARGYMRNIRRGLFKGRLEGMRGVLEYFKQLMMDGLQFQPFIEKIRFRKLKVVKNCNYTIFEIRPKPIRKKRKPKPKNNSAVVMIKT